MRDFSFKEDGRARVSEYPEENECSLHLRLLKRKVCGIRPAPPTGQGRKKQEVSLASLGRIHIKKVKIGDSKGSFALHKLCVHEDEGARFFDKKEPLDSTAEIKITQAQKAIGESENNGRNSLSTKSKGRRGRFAPEAGTTTK